MAFTVLNDLLSFRSYSSFCVMQMRNTMTSFIVPLKDKHKIKDISEDIEGIFLKLGIGSDLP